MTERPRPPVSQRRFTLRHYRYFLAVAETGSVASAARMISIAQSAMTRSILELEQTLGVPLFARSPKGMVLTHAGHRFQASARKVLSAVAESASITEVPALPITGRLSLGVTSLVAGYYLANLLSRFQRQHPQVQIGVVEDQPQFLEHLVVNGELELAIMLVNLLGEPQALVVEVLTRSPNRVWLASGHPLAVRKHCSLVECGAEPQVVLEADRIEGVMQGLWRDHGLTPTEVIRTGSLEAVRSLVGAGAGVALLPDFLYRPWTLDADHVEARPLLDPLPTIDVGLVWRRGGQGPGATAQAFLDIARQQASRPATR